MKAKLRGKFISLSDIIKKLERFYTKNGMAHLLRSSKTKRSKPTKEEEK